MIRYSLFVQPFVYLVLVLSVFHSAGFERTVSQAALTAALVAAWGTVVFTTVGEIGRERAMGTLAAIALTPSGLWGTFLRKAVGSTLLSGGPVVVWLVFAIISKGLGAMSTGLLIISVVLFILGLLALGLLFAALFVIFDRSRFVMNYLELPIFFLSGFFFPISVLGPHLSAVSGALPTSWPVSVMREVVFGQPAQVAPAIGLFIGALLSSSALVIAWAALRFAEVSARRSASLEEQIA
ncbi:MAG: ABC transporter permease [Paracoccus sp. (in: a-proteobacteria)]|nr:ABC transporter permease [Paracoccus sp. (in: a-proteobacteria)]